MNGLTLAQLPVALTLTISLFLTHAATTYSQSPGDVGRTVTKWFSSAPGEQLPQVAPSQMPASAAPTAKPSQVNSQQASSATPPRQASAKVHVLRQTTCHIPFTVDPSRPPPLELQLFVSADDGANWQMTAQAPPTAGHFAFRAPNDGEYWFALRTIERSGRPSDVQKLQPSLKVIFDTQHPAIDFDAQVLSNGEIQATWKIIDDNLAVDSFRIEYQTAVQEPWQIVDTVQGEPVSEGTYSGHCSWLPESAGASVIVRAEIVDKAGNNSVVTRSVSMANSSPAQMETASTHRNTSRTTGESPKLGIGSIAWPLNNVLPKKKPATSSIARGELPPPKPSADRPPLALKRESMRNPYFSTASQTENESPPTDQPEYVEAANSGESVEVSQPDSQASEIAAPPPTPAPTISANEQEPAPAQETTETRSTEPRSTNSVNAQSGEVTINLPAGEKPRMTNSRRFCLEYEVEAIGPAAVNKVELWGTTDGGTSWTRWLDDEDRTSPVNVLVAKDGIYGFRIVIIASNQLSSPIPQAGELADVWVGVDTSKPIVRITSASYGEDENAGKLDIRWEADDEWFADRPIKLSFSSQPDGPWNTIAAGLPNVGQYLWAVEPRIPREIFLRIDAHDDAGNTATHQVTEPINTAGLVPQARIRGVRIVPPTDRSAKRPSAKR